MDNLLPGNSNLGITIRRRPALPLAFWPVIVGLLSAFLFDVILGNFFRLPTIFGFGLTSIGWLLPLMLSLAVLVKNDLGRVRLPYWIWLPWTLWVVVYWVQSDYPNASQRSVMLMTPVVVGMAVSTIRAEIFVLTISARWLDRFFLFFLIAVGTTTGLLTTGQLTDASAFAAGSITASLLAAWYAGRYVIFRGRTDLYRWAMLAAVPVLANTRTGMVAVAITLPLTLAPWPVAKRFFIVGGLIGAGLIVFQMDRIQSKMFYSGQGTLEQAIEGALSLFTGNPTVTDFATSGRFTLTTALRAGLEGHYWFGLGANASESVTVAIAKITHPHNDWLRLQYDYGTLGMLIFALTMVGTALHAYLLARRLPPQSALFLYVGAGAFIPMAIFMFSDNVILYAAWFGNLHFALLGLGYAAARHLPRSQARRLPRVLWRQSR